MDIRAKLRALIPEGVTAKVTTELVFFSSWFLSPKTIDGANEKIVVSTQMRAKELHE